MLRLIGSSVRRMKMSSPSRSAGYRCTCWMSRSSRVCFSSVAPIASNRRHSWRSGTTTSPSLSSYSSSYCSIMRLSPSSAASLRFASRAFIRSEGGA